MPNRLESVLKIIVGDYVATASPVASEVITRKHGLGVSPATIRNDMARLEAEGYIHRPHTSAGAVPTDRGYRYYVECRAGVGELPQSEQCLVRHLFHQVERELEQWGRLAAAMLAQIAGNIGLVTLPRAAKCRFKHLELVALHESLALLVLVLSGARLKQQLLILSEATSQAELSAIANKLNVAYADLSSQEISGLGLELSPLEQAVTRTLARMMGAEDTAEYEELYLEGLRHTLNQPEFAEKRDRGLRLMSLLEERSQLKEILPQGLGGGGVQVVIGGENRCQAMRDYSLVAAGYGVPGKEQGAMAVLGPTRMEYWRTIATVSYLSSLMSELVSTLYGVPLGRHDQ